MRFQACDKSYDNFRKRIKKLLKNVKITLNQLGQKKMYVCLLSLGRSYFLLPTVKFFSLFFGASQGIPCLAISSPYKNF